MQQAERKLYRPDENNMIEFKGKKYDIYNLPAGLVINGDLDLSDLGLTEQPNLSQITINGSLNLSYNPLKTIKQELLPKGIDALEIAGCGLTTQPDLSKTYIKYLDISYNNLKKINQELLSKTLEEFLCINCGLTDIELSKIDIISLDICDNNIKEITSNSLPKNLIYLDCSQNKNLNTINLTSTNQLISVSCNLCNLKEIIIQSKKLLEFNCSDNPNLNTPPKLLVEPQYLDYKGCGFTKKPTWKQAYLETIQKAR